MGTTRTFNDMLNQYLPNTLLKEEMIKRDYLLQNVEVDDNWKGGTIPVPFKAAGASSVKFNGLTSSSDISQSSYVRGTITDYVEVWGSLIFNQRDLVEHDGRINEDSFLKILPDEIDDFVQYMKEVVSVQGLCGPHFATVTDSTNAATGIFIVDRIERFQLGQKVVLDDADTTKADAYVIALNYNTKAVTLSDSRGGSAFNFSAYTLAQAAKFYHDGVTDGSGTHTTFVSMRQVLLSLANGGSTTVHGQTKTAYPVLQALNIDGSAMSAVNCLDTIFDAYVTVQRRGKGKADTVLMSYGHGGSVLKALEVQKGAYVVTENPKKSLYGWTEITISKVATGMPLKLVFIQEMDDDIIPFVYWKGVTFRTNGFFSRRKSPDGNEYFEVRNTTGYQYIVDTRLFGELEWRKPGEMAIIYGITYLG